MNIAVFLLSAGILAFEVVLMRMFFIAQWHHFAAMIISLALLGFGLSGTLLALWPDRLRGRLGACVAAFIVTVPVCVWAAQRIPFTPLLVVWQPRQLLWLFAVYACLAIPFTAGALAVGVALLRARERGHVGATYAANLFGSGLGAVGGLALCFLPLPARMNEYKGLPKTLAMAGARVAWTTHHPLGRVDVVDCPALRIAPGLSLAYAGTMPKQQALFVDGDSGGAINLTGDTEYLDWLPSAAPYQLAARTNVLVVGVGGGAELEQARRFGVASVRGVELHPDVAQLTMGTCVAEGRALIRRSRDRYDLIQISLLDSIATSATGVGAANETHLYTVEAFEEFLAHLSESGVLSITRWLKSPPRDEIKLFATAVEALERAGVDAPGHHLVFVRGWATGTLLVKATAFVPDEVARVRAWAERCAFDVDYFPGATERDVNVRNVLPEPVYFRAAQALLAGNRAAFYREHLFNVRPATDDRPYFLHFFRWRHAPHLLRTMGREWIPFVEWGYVVQVATLAQAIVASVVLILLPARRTKARPATSLYFAAIGMAFMFVEIALLQKFVLILGHPLHAASAVIATVLIVAGLGAARNVRDARGPAALVAGLSLAATFPWPGFVMMGLLVAAAFFMGMMFPAGLARVLPEEVPWAWAVNGCCSVIGATLAGVLAMDFGFGAVLTAGAAMYVGAGLLFRRLD